MAERTAPTHSPLRRLVAWVVILALAAVAVWLASERNARRWALVPEGGKLVVKKGVLLPAGRADFTSPDPEQRRAYAPLEPPAGAPLPEERTFDDRAELDQALYALLSAWARPDVESDDPQRLERGLGYVARAERLAGISAAQREDLRSLRAESGFFEGRRLLEKGAEDLRQAREKLRLAADAPSRHAAEALALLRRLDPLVEGAFQASRAAAAPARPPEAPRGAAPAPDGGPR